MNIHTIFILSFLVLTIEEGVKMVCGNTGDIAIPKKCLPKNFNSWVKP